MIPIRGTNYKNNDPNCKNSKIKVEIRIRPRINNIIQVDNNIISVADKKYQFSKIYGIESTQEEIFNESVIPMLHNFNEGNNSTIFAYGQTGSGKTYTMGISLDKLINFLKYQTDEDQGIVLKTLKYLFINEERTYKCNFFEIYNGECYDLLNERNKLEVRESKGEVIMGLKDILINKLSEAIEILKISCLGRTTNHTLMNEHSSRSHAVFSISNENATLSFIDLAGSERIKKTAVKGIGIKESISINSGLLSLGNVINALYKKLNYIPFRQNKLTRILQPYFSGNSLTLMLACISSCSSDVPETQNTLKYASRASKIESQTPYKLILDPRGKEILELKKEIQRLKQENYILSKGRQINDTKMDLLNSFIEKDDNEENERLKKEIIKLNIEIIELKKEITKLNKKRVTFKMPEIKNKESQNKENHVKLNILSLNNNNENKTISGIKKHKSEEFEKVVFKGHKNIVKCLINSDNLISVSQDGMIIEWINNKSEVIIKKESPIFHALKINDKLFYTHKRQVLCKINNKEETIINEYKSYVTIFLFNKNYLFTGHHDGTLYCYDVINKNMLFEIRKHKHSITNLVFSENTIFSAGRDNQIISYTQKEVLNLVPTHYDIVSVLISNNNILLSAGKDCSIKIWDIKTKKLLKNYAYAHKSWIKAGCLKNNKFCTVSRDGILKIWEYETDLKLIKEEKTIKEVTTIMSYKEGFVISGENGIITFI